MSLVCCVQRKVVEQDLTHTSFMMLPLTIFILFLAYNYQKVRANQFKCTTAATATFLCFVLLVSFVVVNLDKTGVSVWEFLRQDFCLPARDVKFHEFSWRENFIEIFSLKFFKNLIF